MIKSGGPIRVLVVDDSAVMRQMISALLSADPGLVGLNTLQHWLWQRLQATPSSQVAA